MPRRIGNANRERERSRQEALQARLAARYARSMRSEIAGAMREAATLYPRIGEASASQGAEDHAKAVLRIWTAGATASMELMARRVLDAASTGGKAAHPIHAMLIKSDADDWTRTQARIAAYLARWGVQKVSEISRTTQDQIRAIIQRGAADGLGTDAIARLIRQESSITAALRAHVIARTETHAAANYGADAGARESGVVMRREWIAVHDSRSREAHVEADGQTVAMDEPFVVDGEELIYPGDPSGSPENVIMCRCAVGFVVV